MVKIRLRRTGTKGRPFYRVVVAKSTAARNGTFVEAIGTYDPIVKPTKIAVNEERALHWLRMGAQPTETSAYLLNKIGILEKYFEERPAARKQYGFLDKRTAATSVASVIDHTPAPAPKKEKVEEAPVVEATPAATVDVIEEAPAEATASVEAVAEVEAIGEPAALEEPAVEPEAAVETATAEAEATAETASAEAQEEVPETTE